MANTFEDQAKDRFTRSLAFMDKAQTLLHDDLVYRSALADAVSAIKNMLQGYLLLRVAVSPTSAVTQRWQETAASNRMPELLAACGEAGLDLRGVAVEIKQLNNDRNLRAHDDPQAHVDLRQSQRAVELAREVQRRIREVVEGRAGSSSLSARAAGVARAVGSGKLHALTSSVASSQAASGHERRTASVEAAFGDLTSVTTASASGTNGHTPLSPTETSVTRVAAQSANVAGGPASGGQQTTAGMSSGDSTSAEDADDSDEVPVVQTWKGRPGRVRRVLVRALVAAALLIAGAGAGVGAAMPLATGHAPGWMGFASGWFASVDASSARPVATATPTVRSVPVQSGPVTLGVLVVSTPECVSGAVVVSLTNSGSTSLAWAAGIPDGTGQLSAAAGAPEAPAVLGTLEPGTSVSLRAAGQGAAFHIVITGPAGVVELLAPAC